MAYSDDLRQTTGVDFEDVADLIDGLSGVWTDFTPSPVSLSGTGTFTNIFSRYSKVNKIVHISIYIKFIQASSTTQYVTFTLPFTSVTNSDAQYAGGIYTETVSGRGAGAYISILSNTTTARVYFDNLHTVWPIAASATNYFIGNFFYEAA